MAIPKRSVSRMFWSGSSRFMKRLPSRALPQAGAAVLLALALREPVRERPTPTPHHTPLAAASPVASAAASSERGPWPARNEGRRRSASARFAAGLPGQRQQARRVGVRGEEGRDGERPPRRRRSPGSSRPSPSAGGAPAPGRGMVAARCLDRLRRRPRLLGADGEGGGRRAAWRRRGRPASRAPPASAAACRRVGLAATARRRTARPPSRRRCGRGGAPCPSRARRTHAESTERARSLASMMSLMPS